MTEMEYSGSVPHRRESDSAADSFEGELRLDSQNGSSRAIESGISSYMDVDPISRPIELLNRDGGGLSGGVLVDILGCENPPSERQPVSLSEFPSHSLQNGASSATLSEPTPIASPSTSVISLPRAPPLQTHSVHPHTSESPDELLAAHTIKRPRESPGVLTQLRQREIQHAPPCAHINRARRMYTNITPWHYTTDLVLPSITVRTFSPDGNFLICLSASLKELVIMRYHRTLQVWGLDVDFDDFFEPHTRIRLVQEGAISKDFFVFCGEYLIVATMGVPSPLREDCLVISDSANAASLRSVQYSSDYTFHLIHIANARRTDMVTFKQDYMMLMYRQTSVSLYDDMLCILSVQHQIIHFLRIMKNGTFVPVKRIGHHCFDDDQLTIDINNDSERLYNELSGDSVKRCDNEPPRQRRRTGEVSSPSLWVSHAQRVADLAFYSAPSRGRMRSAPELRGEWFPSDPPPAPRLGVRDYNDEYDGDELITGIRHRLITFLFKQAHANGTLNIFRWNFNNYLRMTMSRLQFLDAEHILIRFGNPNNVAKAQESVRQSSFLVLYNHTTTEVLGVYEGSDRRLFACSVFYADMFANSLSRYISSAQNNLVMRERLNKYWKCGPESSRRVVSSLPMVSQAMPVTPYLDHSLFQFDPKVISVERLHTHSELLPTRFCTKDGNFMRFALKAPAPDGRRGTVSHVFHPTEPLVVSSQTTSASLSTPTIAIQFRL